MSGTHDNQLLGSVVRICQAGATFYQHMAKQVDSLTLSSLFREMSHIRQEAVAGLNKFQPATDGSEQPSLQRLITKLEHAYADLQRASTPEYQDDAFLEQLERIEAHVIDALRSSVRTAKEPHTADTLARYIATLQVTHDRLKTTIIDLQRHAVKPH